MDQLILSANPNAVPSLLPLTAHNLRQSSPLSKLKSIQTSPEEPLRSSFTAFNGHPHLDQTEQIHAHYIKTQFNHSLNFRPPHLSPEAKYNFLMSSYIKNEYPEIALKLYTHMRRMDIGVDAFIVPSVLKACAQVSSDLIGKEIHGFSIKNGLGGDVFVCNAFIHMYAESASLVSARLLFDKMPNRDGVSWSTMIGSYCRKKLFDDAMKLMREMNYVGMKPSEIAIISMINVFAELSDMKLGKTMHGYIIRNVNNERMEALITTSLIDMYCKGNNLASAQKLFNGLLPQRSVVSWTAMVAGYIRNGKLEEGAKNFSRMLEESVFPNEITLISLITECSFIGALNLGKWLHSHILRNGFDMSLPLATSLIDMYGKCGKDRYARNIFDGVEKNDVKIWSSMISAYAQVSCIDQAFSIFFKMLESEVKPNKVTMVSILSLCAEVGALSHGKWIHAYINHNNLEVDVILKTALVDMYAKCGALEFACSLFNEDSQRDIGMWNAMIGGLSMHGRGKEALELFYEMESQGVEPNDITVLSVLHACSHSGLVAEGKKHFNKMVYGFGFVPKIEHYGCLVDLLGRAGHLDEAYNIIQNMPMRPNTIVWGALLAACKLHKNLALGEVAAGKILELDPQNCGYNVLRSNIYASENRWNDVKKIRKSMDSLGIKKEPGLSWIEVNGSIHQFTSGDKKCTEIKRVYAMVAEMNFKLKEAGYKPNTSIVLLNVEDEEKESILNYHSEKLAMAFGIISTGPRTPIRIVKNLRVCDDCHSATKLLSKIYQRTIIVRDRNRFHHFCEGYCSCLDYW